MIAYPQLYVPLLSLKRAGTAGSGHLTRTLTAPRHLAKCPCDTEYATCECGFGNDKQSAGPVTVDVTGSPTAYNHTLPCTAPTCLSLAGTYATACGTTKCASARQFVCTGGLGQALYYEQTLEIIYQSVDNIDVSLKGGYRIVSAGGWEAGQYPTGVFDGQLPGPIPACRPAVIESTNGGTYQAEEIEACPGVFLPRSCTGYMNCPSCGVTDSGQNNCSVHSYTLTVQL